MTSLFAALDVATGGIIGKCCRRRRSESFLNFPKGTHKTVPTELDLHLVLHNYGTHRTLRVRRWPQKRSRDHLHFAPTHAFWLNQAERCSHNGILNAVRMPACGNWRRPFPKLWGCIIKTSHRWFGSRRPTDPGFDSHFAFATVAAHGSYSYARNQGLRRLELI